ncbi:DUF5906 domain-containing protein [Janthinobacterium sp.]|uniref:DUF5906 domain-containing protein n=1 Tax=Janthinobacterium sp. TaxID=1871054 RepID=UPI00293D9B18|nr:DUF5906 domain-containing protein [Janthinobacterium sp.]
MTPATLSTAGVALSFVSPCDRDVWVRMGMALKAEFGEDARDVWLTWSAEYDGFDAGAAASSWRSFKNGGKIGIGSLFAAAQAEGFKFDQAGVEVSPEKLAADRLARTERDAKAEADRLARAAAAGVRAQAQWRMAAKTGESPYLAGKLVEAEACRYTGAGGIIVPFMRYDFEPARMVGKQAIDAAGVKKNSGGMDKLAAACRLGDVPQDGDDIGIGEGYATGLSVRMATQRAFAYYMAIDAGNLPHVARLLRAKFPSSRLLIFADDDYLTGGAGVIKAEQAATAVGNAVVLVPAITAPRRATKKDESLPKLTDFNDLHVAQSLAEVTAQIAAALAAPAVDRGAPVPHDDGAAGEPPIPAPLASDDPVGINIPTAEALIAHFSIIYPTTDIWDGLRKQRMKRSAFNAWVGKDLAAAWEKDGRRRTILRDSLPVLVGGRAIPGGAGGGKLGEMLDNITLLRGTETVWDAIGQQVMTLGAVRADYTADLTSKWQEHALRKTVEAKNLVFDPTQRADPVTHVNIFLGWPLIPKADADLVLPILALLESLCGAEDNVDDCVVWILRWLAYPLQNPGAKMQTALLMFGEKQGTGKSLFFQDVMGPIYGDYGTVASQHQLDSSFTAWRSAKLFVLFEEVLSREDKYSHNGTLKYMITGKSMSINQKNLPERTEQNHLNAAFLSNEPQPIPIELEDRRFMVIEARNKQPEAFYNAVTDSIARGGLAAFYDFLLAFPMDGFNAHTKPMMTLAKERVIEFGLNGWMSFHRSWKDGYLSAPYCSCLSEDLYTIYRRWCDRSGEKPLTLCKFAGLIASREHKVKRSVAVGSKGKTTRMIFEVKHEGETDTVDQQIERFRDLADVRGGGAVQG